MARFAAAACSALLLGCDLIAPVNLEYVGPDAGDAAPSTDSGVDVGVADGDAVGPGGACGCDFVSGEGCCVPKGGGSAFCTSDAKGCAQQGDIFVGCNVSGTDSFCCWSSKLAAGGSVIAYAGACTLGPESCIVSSDCHTGTCDVATCGGVTIGACGETPTCP